MPSAVELFYSRRSRPIRPDPLAEEPHTSPNRNLHHNNSGRRHHQSRRHDDAGGFPLRHSSSRAASFFHDRRDQYDEDTGGGNVERLRSSRRPANAMGPSERLPGAVLLARARLLERLRGPENRQSGTASPPTNYRDHNFGDEFGLADAGDWGTNNSSLARSTSFVDFISEAQRIAYLREKYRKPPGLMQEAVESLQVEIFSRTENDINDTNLWGGSGDCSICLESFVEGDRLVCLPCVHKFHSACLDPWVRTCGACPYCRRGIL